MGEPNGGPGAGYQPQNTSDWVVAYVVVQGNAIGLCNSRGSAGAYSNFGRGVLAIARSFPSCDFLTLRWAGIQFAALR